VCWLLVISIDASFFPPLAPFPLILLPLSMPLHCRETTLLQLGRLWDCCYLTQWSLGSIETYLCLFSLNVFVEQRQQPRVHFITGADSIYYRNYMWSRSRSVLKCNVMWLCNYFLLLKSVIRSLWELLLGQFLGSVGCTTPIEPISMGAAAPTVPKNSLPMEADSGGFCCCCYFLLLIIIFADFIIHLLYTVSSMV